MKYCLFPIPNRKVDCPPARLASIGPGRFRVAISTRVSSCQPKHFNFACRLFNRFDAASLTASCRLVKEGE